MVEVDSLPENSSVSASSEIPSVPQVKDGMLYFKTKSDFDAVADYLIDNQEDDGLDGFEDAGRDPSFPGPPGQIRTGALAHPAPPLGCIRMHDGKSSCRIRTRIPYAKANFSVSDLCA